MSQLQIAWYVIIGLLFTGFVTLSGTDLGLGIWRLFARSDEQKKAILGLIKPYWDSNTVWLITAGALLFAAFPPVYATFLSSLYIPVILLLFSIIFRDISIELPDHVNSKKCKSALGTVLGISSFFVVLIFGVGLGNVMRGIPIDQSGHFTGTLAGLFNWYAILIGVAGLSMIAMHGAVFGAVKSEGDLSQWMKKCSMRSCIVFVMLFIFVVLATLFTQRHLISNYVQIPSLWIIPILTFLAIIATGIFSEKEAMITSTISAIGVIATISIALYPTLIPSLNSPGNNLTAFNSSSSHLTLLVMLPITLIGMSIVIGYTIYARRPFRGKIYGE